MLDVSNGNFFWKKNYVALNCCEVYCKIALRWISGMVSAVNT
jgi:hypothetical protein